MNYGKAAPTHDINVPLAFSASDSVRNHAAIDSSVLRLCIVQIKLDKGKEGFAIKPLETMNNKCLKGSKRQLKMEPIIYA